MEHGGAWPQHQVYVPALHELFKRPGRFVEWEDRVEDRFDGFCGAGEGGEDGHQPGRRGRGSGMTRMWAGM